MDSKRRICNNLLHLKFVMLLTYRSNTFVLCPGRLGRDGELLVVFARPAPCGPCGQPTPRKVPPRVQQPVTFCSSITRYLNFVHMYGKESIAEALIGVRAAHASCGTGTMSTLLLLLLLTSVALPSTLAAYDAPECPGGCIIASVVQPKRVCTCVQPSTCLNRRLAISSGVEAAAWGGGFKTLSNLLALASLGGDRCNLCDEEAFTYRCVTPPAQACITGTQSLPDSWHSWQ